MFSAKRADQVSIFELAVTGSCAGHGLTDSWSLIRSILFLIDSASPVEVWMRGLDVLVDVVKIEVDGGEDAALADDVVLDGVNT